MSQSISSSVDVDVDPSTAFDVFTQEINCWWLQGPINFHDSSRAIEIRIEPGVGGRVLEVHDSASGEGLELGRITDWQPGSRLAWRSSIDDVLIEVRFGASSQGTRVTVTATIPEQGRDSGGTAWVRMTPVWFGRWFAHRATSGNQPLRMARLAIAVHYHQPARAARWLREAFGLMPAGVIPEEERPIEETWIEFHVGNAAVVILGCEEAHTNATTHVPWIFVDNLEAHFERAVAHGATISQPIQTHGARTYVAQDHEGRLWTFAQASPIMLTENP